MLSCLTNCLSSLFYQQHHKCLSLFLVVLDFRYKCNFFTTMSSFTLEFFQRETIPLGRRTIVVLLVVKKMREEYKYEKNDVFVFCGY